MAELPGKTSQPSAQRAASRADAGAGKTPTGAPRSDENGQASAGVPPDAGGGSGGRGGAPTSGSGDGRHARTPGAMRHISFDAAFETDLHLLSVAELLYAGIDLSSD